jgi:hypothetical protein
MTDSWIIGNTATASGSPHPVVEGAGLTNTGSFNPRSPVNPLPGRAELTRTIVATNLAQLGGPSCNSTGQTFPAGHSSGEPAAPQVDGGKRHNRRVAAPGGTAAPLAEDPDIGAGPKRSLHGQSEPIGRCVLLPIKVMMS